MPTLRLPSALAILVLVLVATSGGALASDRSELLVAQGEVAYHAGRFEAARTLFTEALAADPTDEAAKGWLDLLAARLPEERARGERRERAARPWDLEIGTGIQYDSNVRLDPRDGRDSAGFLFRLGGHYDPYRDDRTLVRFDYDFFQVLHTDVRDYHVRSHRWRGTASRALMPSLWVGAQAGYDHVTLDSHAYLQEPWVMPYLSILESDLGATQIVYRHAEQDYLGSPFGDNAIDRDGPTDATGVNRLLYFFDRRVTANIGYAYEEATPHKRIGDDYARQTHQARVGVRFPAWWRTFVELEYTYRYEDYTEPNTAVGGRKTRQDNGSYVAAFLRRPIYANVDGVVSYFAVVNGSNIPIYDYDRHVVAFELRYSF
jgi:hypothetical protein